MTEDFTKDDEIEEDVCSCRFCNDTFLQLQARTKEFALTKAIEVRMNVTGSRSDTDIVETAKIFERFLNEAPEMPDALATTETKN